MILSAMSLFGFLARAEPLAVGSKAPVITAINQDGAPVDFGEIYAKGTTLVYFYPKAGTPGCTAQACSLRDSFVPFAKPYIPCPPDFDYLSHFPFSTGERRPLIRNRQ
jgi:AhpC/TSA family